MHVDDKGAPLDFVCVAAIEDLNKDHFTIAGPLNAPDFFALRKPSTFSITGGSGEHHGAQGSVTVARRTIESGQYKGTNITEWTACFD